MNEKNNMLKNFKTKKGQLYVIVAILVCSVLVTVFSASFNVKYDPNTVQMQRLCSYFKEESIDLVNSIILKEDDVVGNYNSFAKNYYNYAKSIHSNFGVFYVISYGNLSYIADYLDTDLNITINGDNKYLLKYPYSGYGMYVTNFSNLEFSYANNIYNYSREHELSLDILCIYKKSNGDLTIVA
jgi:hypothetical protein